MIFEVAFLIYAVLLMWTAVEFKGKVRLFSLSSLGLIVFSFFVFNIQSDLIWLPVVVGFSVCFLGWLHYLNKELETISGGVVGSPTSKGGIP